ncbi:MAG: hypothetical protein AVDCRST_MAG56-7797 [uncultured Cytophagales bacterium]|uniref:Secretion system C-terminal sorting domain-containing protein n=1 Tax=uncultured Cytophagales bacterium TaxID=158755 RepID=A0A6J4LFV8_9SPHI|nr:MAG: hypothetical protein AVDCRST_MAG56-7797 [uncultured Cytophagales bacterium]
MKKFILFLIVTTQLAGATIAWERDAALRQEPSQAPAATEFPKVATLLSADEPRSNELLFNNEHISVSSIYPNPASTSAAIRYRFTGGLRDAKIVLCNVLGNVVGEYRLSRETRDMTELHITTSSLASGVYFYTLSLDGRNVVTRKLIVRHPS